MEEARAELKDIRNHHLTKDLPLVVLANKQDTPGAVKQPHNFLMWRHVTLVHRQCKNSENKNINLILTEPFLFCWSTQCQPNTRKTAVECIIFPVIAKTGAGVFEAVRTLLHLKELEMQIA